jgi:hypothetical protein
MTDTRLASCERSGLDSITALCWMSEASIRLREAQNQIDREVARNRGLSGVESPQSAVRAGSERDFQQYGFRPCGLEFVEVGLLNDALSSNVSYGCDDGASTRDEVAQRYERRPVTFFSSGVCRFRISS